jgi:hypothetical protein
LVPLAREAISGQHQHACLHTHDWATLAGL